MCAGSGASEPRSRGVSQSVSSSAAPFSPPHATANTLEMELERERGEQEKEVERSMLVQWSLLYVQQDRGDNYYCDTSLSNKDAFSIRTVEYL